MVAQENDSAIQTSTTLTPTNETSFVEQPVTEVQSEPSTVESKLKMLEQEQE